MISFLLVPNFLLLPTNILLLKKILTLSVNFEKNHNFRRGCKPSITALLYTTWKLHIFMLYTSYWVTRKLTTSSPKYCRTSVVGQSLNMIYQNVIAVCW